MCVYASLYRTWHRRLQQRAARLQGVVDGGVLREEGGGGRQDLFWVLEKTISFVISKMPHTVDGCT